MLLLIDINKGRRYENPSLNIIITERCSTGGCPLEEACEHFFLNQSVNYCCCSYIIYVLLWRLCWLYYYYSAISSILFMYCILFISSILQVVLEHFPGTMGSPFCRKKIWLETCSGVFKPRDLSLSAQTYGFGEACTQEIQEVVTLVGLPCSPCGYPFE